MSSPVNPIKEVPQEALQAELLKMGAEPNGPVLIAFRDMKKSTDKTLTAAGAIQPQAPIGSNSVGIGITVQNLDAAGNLASLANVNDASTDHLTDGTGTPLAGGVLARAALDNNARLVNSFRATAVNVTVAATAATGLSNTGVATAVSIASSTNQFAPGTVAYNSGSYDPGSFETTYVAALDPTFVGGAVTYTFGTTPQSTVTAEGQVYFGKITTVNGTPKTGGGNTGGTTSGGAGGNRGL